MCALQPGGAAGKLTAVGTHALSLSLTQTPPYGILIVMESCFDRARHNPYGTRDQYVAVLLDWNGQKYKITSKAIHPNFRVQEGGGGGGA